MLIRVITKLVPLVRSFIEAIKDRKLTGEELEALSVEAGLAIAEVLRDFGVKLEVKE